MIITCLWPALGKVNWCKHGRAGRCCWFRFDFFEELEEVKLLILQQLVPADTGVAKEVVARLSLSFAQQSGDSRARVCTQ